MLTEAEQVAADPAGHVVRFYDADDELADLVGCYLGDGLRAGESVIVIATPAHRQAFEQRIAASGVDVPGARGSGSYVALDAAETMRRLLAGDRPDPGGFDTVIGGLIGAAAAAGRPVRVYGEMVALLWEAGHVNAAIELETLWNDLGARHRFALLCAYPAGLVSGEESEAAVDEVCRLHSAVAARRTLGTGPEHAGASAGKAARSFGNSHYSPGAARDFVRDTLRGWADPVATADAVIIASELAANAVLHARSGFTISLSRSAKAVRIEVSDLEPMTAGNGDPALMPRQGHGLGLVAELADTWAAEPWPGGKTIWAELPARAVG
jgi:anti-sigma regulatory factor (Ser/Thr protein kinase)